MSTGQRLAGLLMLTTALSFPVSGFAQAIGVPPGDDPSTEAAEQEMLDQVDPAQDELGEETYDEGPDVSIPGGAIIVTGRRNRDPVRASTQVVSVLSAEDIARTGEGDIAGALSRVTGLTVVGSGRVYVRGLGDRYSLAMLNGLPLPSPEPLSRVVPLDIFPTNVIASSLVQKTYSANFPGEFGGGVINLTTRAIPDESFVKISASAGGDTRTLGRDGLTYYGSDFDWVGFDNGNRDIPSNLQNFIDSGERLQNVTTDVQEGIASQLWPLNLSTVTRDGDLPPNFSGSVTAGTSLDVGSDGILGVVATAGIKNSWRNRSIRSQRANTDLSQLSDDWTTFVTDNRVLVNALLGVGLDIGDHTLRWTNLYIRDTLKQASLGVGYAYEDEYDLIEQNTAWYERQLIDSQFVGEFEFGRFSLDVRGGYAQTDREAPYNLTFNYVKTNLDTPTGDYYVANVTNQINNVDPITSAFDDLTEKLWFGGIDASYELLDNLTATVGYAYSDTSRYSTRREFQLQMATDPNTVGLGLTQEVLNAVALRRPGDLINGASLAGFAVGLAETTNFPAFDAGLEIHAGYGKVSFLPVDTVTIDLGARYEDATQTVALDQSVFNTPIVGANETYIANDYLLPAGTVTWEATDQLQFRVSGSKTIARPQFRELVEQTYFDPDNNRQYRGNPFLSDSELLNLEARAEYYIAGQDHISLAGFYKKIDNPIEAIVLSLPGGGRYTTFANVPQAELYGAELEVQYSVDLFDMGGWFMNKQIVGIANYTYTKSELSYSDGDTTTIPGSETLVSNFVDPGDPMTGQSDHIANLQLGLEDTEELSQFTFLLSYASKRVTRRDFQRPDIIENPGLTVDFVARQGADFLGVPVELEFEARNIFGRDNFEYQANDQYRIENNTYAVGTSFSLGVSMEF
ncbi:TonB-dependent receptor domain-containing protein [Croceicoccus gelatinilyticus]|uniref:TonB-dependent receptor domain-containing protein n=1 Tax=Croceicoccus gelatinilyticus TaxID=2835536 RepID=UPI001BCCC773|nr:TonB-dependent receptor [Croceicoccus gelatinilyticus]MBS7671275.1 TonB-dependent receptor [Croceicoccus gelatinilyticus]